MLYYLPLEPIEQRYTSQWWNWFQLLFRQQGINFRYIAGEKIKSELQGTQFLDMKSTFVWKFQQLKELFKKDLQSGDKIFIPDGEFPGIEALEYFKKFFNKDIEIYQIWHAGTYDYWDLTTQNGLQRIGKNFEEGWFDIATKIFVASNFHKKLILQNRIVDKDKIIVTGLPADVKYIHKNYDKKNKQKQIVFTGRKSVEKGWDTVSELRILYSIIVTNDLNLSKSDYYKLLGNSHAVFAPSRQETFGYGVVEGMAAGAFPIVPDGLSFTDFVPKQFRYKNRNEMLMMLDKIYFRQNNKRLYKSVKGYNYDLIIKKMLKECNL